MPDDDDLDVLGACDENATDQEILDEAAAGGVDVKIEAARVRAVLTDAVQRAKAADLDCWSPALPAALALATGERFTMGVPQPLAQRQAFRPTRIDVSLPPVPFICTPLRLSDCPACGAQPGVRCTGIDRDDETHVERLWRCLSRWNGAS